MSGWEVWGLEEEENGAAARGSKGEREVEGPLGAVLREDPEQRRSTSGALAEPEEEPSTYEERMRAEGMVTSRDPERPLGHGALKVVCALVLGAPRRSRGDLGAWMIQMGVASGLLVVPDGLVL